MPPTLVLRWSFASMCTPVGWTTTATPMIRAVLLSVILWRNVVGEPSFSGRIPSKGEMALNASPVADRTPTRAFRSAIVAVLALAAILVSLLAIHSVGTGPEVEGTIPAASVHAQTGQPGGGDATIAGALVAAAPVVVQEAAASNGWGANGVWECALLVMGCGLLLVLAALLLARSPAVRDRALRDVVRLLRAIYVPHVCRPSLTVLSVSRV